MARETNYWTRRHAALSRRRLMGSAAAAGVGLGALALAGCGDDDDKTSGGAGTPGGGTPAGRPATTETPRPGGVFKSTTTSPVGIQDPHFGSTPQWTTPYFADPLLKMTNQTRELSGGLVEKWEQPDKQTLVLRLRAGVKFFNMAPANGREMEAKDIVYQLKSMTGSQYPESKIPFPRKSAFDGMKDPIAVDKNTVRLEFTKPRSDIIVLLAEKRTATIPEGFREFAGGIESLQGPRPERLVSTGPYICEKFDGEGDTLWKKNPDYWDKPYPYIDQIQVATVKDNQAWATALITGQNHALTAVQDQTVDLVKRGLPDVQIVKYPPDGYWYHLGLNTRVKPMDDPRVRKALALLFDKPAFSQTIFGRNQPQEWRYPGTLPWVYKEALSQEELGKLPGLRSPTNEDIADAKKLVEAAGYANGFNITILPAAEQLATHQYKAVAEHLKAQVEKYIPNGKITIDLTTYTAMLAKIGQQDAGWGVYTGGWVHELSPIAMFSVSLISKGARNFTAFSDPKQDALIEQASAEFDEAKRTSLLKDAQNLALQNWSHIPTHHGQFTALIHPSVRNLDVGSAAGPSYYVRYAWLKA